MMGPRAGRTRGALLTALLTGLLTAACATGSVSDDAEAFTSTNRPPRVRLVVRNMNFNDVRLFALSQSGRTPIGQVPGKQDREFELEWEYPQNMAVEINMLAGPRCVTDEMQVDPGDILELQIAVVFTETAGCR